VHGSIDDKEILLKIKQSWLVTVFAAVMLSACGNRSEVESSAVKNPTPSAEQKTPVVTEKAVQIATEQKTTATTDNIESAKASAIVKGMSLSREDGLALAKKSGCLACHKIETKLVGPAWRDVSQRYRGVAGAKAQLVKKVKNGGKGNWTAVTGGVPMPPNSPRVSDENIEKLVTFVLSQ
jgi:cytochrome c551/c552